MTKTNILGYVAAFPIPEVIQGIDAFTLGARSVNPKVEVRVIWVNTWYDPGKERAAALTLLSQNADILMHHTDSTATVQAAQEKGKYAFGYHSDMSKYGPDAQLSATIHEWGDYYTESMKSVLAGTWKPKNVWGGYSVGMIRTAPLNKAIPANVVAEVQKIEASLKANKFNPFTGPIKNQDGVVVVPAGQVMTDAEIGKLNFFVEGVASKLPTK
jgi:simple sugar transport system substrate-binding protein